MDDPRTIKVLGFAGSLRKGSYNRMALRAAEELLPDGMTLAIFDIIPIPPYEDVRQAGVALGAGPPR
jgi:chromate reductase